MPVVEHAVVAEDAVVDATATIGAGTRIWDQAVVRAEARVGDECVVGRGAFIDTGVSVQGPDPEPSRARTRQWIVPPGSWMFGVARRLAVRVDHSRVP